MIINLEEIQKAINYTFNDPKLLQNSLVHRSYLSEKYLDHSITENNERLEFLGDAVVELIVTDYLYRNFKQDEGYLTSLRAALVNYKQMGEIGNKLGLDQYTLISVGEKSELGKARLTIVADALEAVIGAIFLDGGYKAAENFIYEFLIPSLKIIVETESYKDAKTKLQESTQKLFHKTPKYNLVRSEGKDHEKIFVVEVWLNDTCLGKGEGKSKQEAETNAAQEGVEYLQNLTEFKN